MGIYFRLLISSVLLMAAGGAAAENYAVGQVWSYKTRPQEPNSTLMILRIDDTSKLGTVIFIGLRELRIQHPNGKVIGSLSPLPFTKEALDQSVIKVVGKADKLMGSDFGYAKWKEDQRAGKTLQVYRKPVAEVVKNNLEDGFFDIPLKRQ